MEIEDFTAQLQEFLSSQDEYRWLVDPRVWMDGDFEKLQKSFDGNKADFLATNVRSREEDPSWNSWRTLQEPSGSSSIPRIRLAAMLPFVRLSKAAAKAVVEGVEAGWEGHPEVVVPTLIAEAGLKIEDIGHKGSYTHLKNIGRWYNRKSWQWHWPVEQVKGMLHFPVPLGTRPLATGRVKSDKTDGHGTKWKILYVSPVGAGAKALLPSVLDSFLNAGADCLLFQYDDAKLPFPSSVKVIREPGYKWQLAVKHLHPDKVTEYDFIFFWDDDLGVKNFDPKRFVEIMHLNRLEMAQPAIQSPYGQSHHITRWRPCPPPLRGPDGEHAIVGRLTNFVEIMAPVFTREAWQEFYAYLDPENRSGWGYDYIPLGRKGIVDALPVVHTRPVQSINSTSEKDLGKFLDSQGLFRHQAVDMGWLIGA